MLRLRDLLTKDKPFDIEYRCNAPKMDDEDDMLFGYCYWDGEVNDLIVLFWGLFNPLSRKPVDG